MTYSNIPAFSVVTVPESEPFTISDAKLYLRVDGATEDTLIGNMIVAARMAAEQYLRRSLITQVRKLAYNETAPSWISLPFGPVQAVSSIKLIDVEGDEVTVNSNSYRLTAGNEAIVSDVALTGNRIEIVYMAGYGNAAAVPEALKQGMLAHVAAFYEGRGGEGVPDMAQALYQPYRVVKL